MTIKELLEFFESCGNMDLSDEIIITLYNHMSEQEKSELYNRYYNELCSPAIKSMLDKGNERTRIICMLSFFSGRLSVRINDCTKNIIKNIFD